MRWNEWVKDYFFKGKTIGVYLLFIMFILSAIELTLLRTYIYNFIPLLVLTVFSYGVFTDLVAHLWWDGINTGLTYKEFFKLVFKGRTHDLYGLIIYLTLALYEFQYINKVGGIILISMDLGVITYLIKTRFYH